VRKSSSSRVNMARTNNRNEGDMRVTDKRRTFARRVKDTMHTISEWAKDPVLDNKHINPCGNIDNTFSSLEQAERSTKKGNASVSPKSTKKVTNVSANEGGYIVDSGKTPLQTQQHSLEDKIPFKKRDPFCLAFSIGRCSPGLFLQYGASQENEPAGLLLCKGGGCTSLDDTPIKEQSSVDAHYEKYIEAEQHQMQRLASWGTYATAETFNTEGCQSISAADSAGTSLLAENGRDAYDDDGNLIDSKIMEGTRKKMEKVKKMQKIYRKRVVKFEYPPITSLKQCPRMDPDDIPRLFFSEEELDMYEDDRRSTFTVDDVEIVAISTSLSEENDPILKGSTVGSITNPSIPKVNLESAVSSTPTSLSTAAAAVVLPPNDNSVRNHVPTPKNGGVANGRKSPRASTPISSADLLGTCSNHRRLPNPAGGRPSTPVSTPAARPSTPASTSRPGTPTASAAGVAPSTTPASQTGLMRSNHDTNTSHFPFEEKIDADNLGDNNLESQQAPSIHTKKREKRLLKSVQIYLRERSTGL
jgi:hypothetical protein